MRPSADAEALALLDAIEAHLRHPAGGFVEAGDPPFQANPHMHLFEACLAWLEAKEADHGGGARFEAVAAEIAELALTRFIDPDAGFVREFFAADWSPAPGEAGRIVEPGHQFEWAWLLERWVGLFDAFEHCGCLNNSALIHLALRLEGIHPEYLYSEPVRGYELAVLAVSCIPNHKDEPALTKMLQHMPPEWVGRHGVITSYERAEAALRRSLEIAPEYDKARATLAAVLCSRHKFAEGLAMARSLIARDPGNIDVMATLGDALLETGQYAEAEAVYRALRKKSEAPPILSRLASLLELKGDPDEALRLMGEAEASARKRGGEKQAAWFKARNLTPTFGAHWHRFPIKPFTLAKEANTEHPADAARLGRLLYSSDRAPIPTWFAEMLIRQIQAASLRTDTKDKSGRDSILV